MNVICKTPIKTNRGFTLVELVSVIVLLGILSIAVIPRFVSRDNFGDYAVRDLAIAAFRIAQQAAMYDHSAGSCYRVRVGSGTIFIERNESGSYNPVGPGNWSNGVILEGGVIADGVIVYFDGLGSPLGITADCTGSVGNTTVPIAGANNLSVCIYETGYIQAC